jgi:hypothetical protein
MSCLFVVGDTEYCHRIDDEPMSEFMAAAKEERGLNLTGPTWGMTNPIA